MAIAFKTANSAADNTTTGTSLAVALTIAVGDAVVVVVYRAGQAAIGTPTDDGGNTYTQQDISNPGAGGELAIFGCIATATATTITGHYTAGQKTQVLAANYSGVSAIGANHNNNNGTSTTETITQTLAVASNWMVAGLGKANVTAPTPVSGNDRKDQAANSSSSSSLFDNTGSTSVTCSGTITSAAFRAASLELVANLPQFEDDTPPVMRYTGFDPDILIWQ
jgi:hypothetical protein